MSRAPVGKTSSFPAPGMGDRAGKGVAAQLRQEVKAAQAGTKGPDAKPAALGRAVSLDRERPVLYFSNLPQEISGVLVSEVIHKECGIETKAVDMLKKGLPGCQKPCGLAAVVLHDMDEAAKVLKAMDGFEILGRPVIVRRDKFVEDAADYHHVELAPPAALQPAAAQH